MAATGIRFIEHHFLPGSYCMIFGIPAKREFGCTATQILA